MRRLIIMGVVVVLTTAAVSLRGCSSHDSRVQVAVPIAADASAGTGSVSGPRAVRLGVPVGWSRDAGGARAAAVSAVSLTGPLVRAGFISRSDMIGVLASDRFAPELAELSAGQWDGFDADVAARGLTVGELVVEEFALTAVVEAVSAEAATVAVWAVAVAGADGAGAPRQLWRTVTVGLVWEHGDWQVDGWAVRAGPTPMAASEAPVASLAELRAVVGWPRVGGG